MGVKSHLGGGPRFPLQLKGCTLKNPGVLNHYAIGGVAAYRTCPRGCSRHYSCSGCKELWLPPTLSRGAPSSSASSQQLVYVWLSLCPWQPPGGSSPPIPSGDLVDFVVSFAVTGLVVADGCVLSPGDFRALSVDSGGHCGCLQALVDVLRLRYDVKFGSGMLEIVGRRVAEVSLGTDSCCERSLELRGRVFYSQSVHSSARRNGARCGNQRCGWTRQTDGWAQVGVLVGWEPVVSVVGVLVSSGHV